MNKFSSATGKQVSPSSERVLSRTCPKILSRHLGAAALALCILFLFWPAVKVIENIGLHEDGDVQIVTAPFLVLFLLYWERDRIFREVRWNPRLGIPALSVALAAYLSFLRSQAYGKGGVGLILAVCALIVAWMSLFILTYGLPSFAAACFPLCCLIMMIPVPTRLLDGLTAALQHGSAATSIEMLRLVGIPVFAQGTKLLLPGLEIEVAPECSGIHSCLSLALVALVAGRLCLRSGWCRFLLLAFTIPFAIFKNAIRISTIASLGAYVNHAFLFGPIHHYGGLVFTPIALVLLVLVLFGLQKSETWMVSRLGGRPMIEERAATATAHE
jgi:exosortase